MIMCDILNQSDKRWLSLTGSVEIEVLVRVEGGSEHFNVPDDELGG